ncbi:hypothetical protein WICPIJ_003082 [Wickerhamomyces pijperi]|uniref:E3 ubiquitin ligase complex SCF subunit n=1 Tax=Wickerhamomyces pijperi TaxID=599730 RepID=A0A9P8QAI6_WICPI|nr:hypothetical protein WICPIJ_003082 [Wickerhamomyces pijperi]
MIERVKLQSQDDQEFDLERQLIERSVLLKNLLNDTEYDYADSEPIPLPNVKGATLKKVIEWCEHHKDSTFPDDNDEDARKSAPLDDWDKTFLNNVDDEMLYEIILAANYLNIRPLLDSGCKTIAEMIRGKSADEIRRIFNIPVETETKASA